MLKRRVDWCQKEQERRRKRRKARRLDTLSDSVDSDQRFISDHVVLEPKARLACLGNPSLRSSSPVRETIRLLQRKTEGTFCIRLESPFRCHPQYVEPAVAELQRLLVRDAAVGVIPNYVRHEFERLQPAVYQETPETAFADFERYASHDVQASDSIFADFHAVAGQARECRDKLKDENAWSQVVEKVLALSLRNDPNGNLFEVNNIKSQSIDPRFLPSVPVGRRFELVNAKSDFALTLTEENDGRDMPLSPMADAYTSKMCLTCPIEVKRHGGSAEEAELEMIVWQAAALAHMKYLRDHGKNPELQIPPVIGCTVVGHSWSFSIAWTKNTSSDYMTVMGPFSPSNAGTSDVASIFVLLALWRRLTGWFWNHYYTAYCELLQASIDTYETGLRKEGRQPHDSDIETDSESSCC